MTDEEFSTYWSFLVEKRHAATEALSRDERVFYVANIFRGSVSRSGLTGYFESTECDVIRDADHALATLGLPEAQRLLQDAQKIVLNGAPLPETDQCLSLYDDSLTEEEFARAMDELEEKLGEIQRQLYAQDQAIVEALCRFADERQLRAPRG